MSFPGDFGTGGLGSGAVLTTAGYLGAECPPGSAPSCRPTARTNLQSIILAQGARRAGQLR